MNPRRTRQSTVAPGISIGNAGGGKGTLGAIVRDPTSKRLLGLSNCHVLARFDGNSEIVQPGPEDEIAPDLHLGTLGQNGIGLDGDAGLTTIEGRLIEPRIFGLGVAVESLAEPRVGDKVVKSGRTTEITHGVVLEAAKPVRLKYQLFPERRTVMVAVIGPDPDFPGQGPLVADGDSGSMWMRWVPGDPNGKASSVAVALQTQMDTITGHALACPAPGVFAMLGIEPAPLAELEAEAEAAFAHHEEMMAMSAPVMLPSLPQPQPPFFGAAALAGAPLGAMVVPHRVTARKLMLRATASTNQAPIGERTFGAVVNVLGREGDWLKVDLHGDGIADGFMAASFLDPVAGGVPQATVPPPLGGDVTALVTAAMAKTMCPGAGSLALNKNLPFVLAGLRACSLGDRDMIAMAFATINAETAGFVPIDEFKSTFNTNVVPFDKYEPGTSVGKRLGNTKAGDGARFKGRGFIQLTGRDNYTRIGKQIGVDLAKSPELANDGATAGRILAQFLKNVEGPIRAALAAGDLKTARKLVNGGSHGFDAFRAAMDRRNVLPG